MNRTRRQAETKPLAPAAQSESTPVRRLFAEGLQHHQAGRLNEAEALYRQALALDPRHSDSLHLLGVLALQNGRWDVAADLIGMAIGINARVPHYHSNLGVALMERGQLGKAADCYRMAIQLNPDFCDAHNNLGNVLERQGQMEGAAASFRSAIRIDPGSPDRHISLGNVLRQMGEMADAVVCFRRAVRLRPDYADAHNNLGVALAEQGLHGDAVACYRRAVELKPDYADAHNNLGVALAEQGLPGEAVACFRRSVAIKPDIPTAHNNWGNVLRKQGHLDQAVACYRRAIGIKPDYAEARANLGMAMVEQRLFREAEACFREAIAVKPDYANAHFNLAIALLAQGNMAAGWQEYEWRWKMPVLAGSRRNFVQPQWRGEAAAGKTLLIHAEQGFGDTLQFCRYAALASARGMRVIMEVQGPLVRLLRGGLAGTDRILAVGDDLPPFDLHCPMLSMPLAAGTVMASIPAPAPYLQARGELAAAWRTRLDAAPGRGPRIGLVWAGSATMTRDSSRSVDPELLAPLFGVPGVRFFSLQMDRPAAPSGFPLTDFMDGVADFADTAALIANLDLVISVDTAAAHLAAAMGKPVWLLDRFDSCWRWLTGRRDSPWYPSLRLYRQPHPGGWEPVIAEVAGDLRLLAEQAGTRLSAV